MRFQKILLPVIVCCCSILQAQDLQKIDSLVALVLSIDAENRAVIYADISIEIVRLDRGLGVAYADSAVLFAELFSDNDELTKIYTLAGRSYQAAIRDSMAVACFSKALMKYREMDYRDGIAHSLYLLGRNFYWQRLYDSSLVYLDEAERIVVKSENHKLKSDILIARADICRREGDFTNNLLLLREAESIKLKLNDLEGLNDLYSSWAASYYSLGNYEEAIIYYRKAKDYRLQLGRRIDAATIETNIGNAYNVLDKDNLALESYNEALKVYEEYNFKSGITRANNGIAVIYEERKQFEKAKNTYLEILEINRSMGDKKEIATILNNLGILYSMLSLDTIQKTYGHDIIDSIFEESTNKYFDFFSYAIDYFRQSLEVSKELGNKQLIAKALSNIGTNFLFSGKLDRAEDYFNQSIAASREAADMNQLAHGYLMTGKINLYRNRYNTALSNFNKSLEYAREGNILDIQKDVYSNISELYTRLNNHRKALDYYKLYSIVMDSLSNLTIRNLAEEFEVQKERDMERASQMVDNINKLWEQEKELQSTRNRIQLILIISFSLLLLLALVAAFYILRAYRSKQRAFTLLTRQKKEIELQRDEIESQRDEIIHQKDIVTKQKDQLSEQKQSLTDSINYASKIQSAIIPSDELLRHYLPKHFVLFKPRDIVSGDFYWIGSKEGKVIVAVVDCTGHGVPGAFMSVMGSSQLNEIIGRIRKIETNEILDELRDMIIISLRQTGRAGEAKDGMDMTLCIFDFKKKNLQFSGAHNPLYLVRDKELIEYKGDKMPIGIHALAGKPFSKTDIQLQRGDAIYMFSDGYADQFGGPMGKKFKYSQFKNLLLEVQDNIMFDQKEILEQELNHWMSGNGEGPDVYEQVDDILVMGIKI